MLPWSLPKRILFRFAVAFFVLINFPFPFDVIPIGALEPVFQKISDAPVHLAALCVQQRVLLLRREVAEAGLLRQPLLELR